MRDFLTKPCSLTIFLRLLNYIFAGATSKKLSFNFLFYRILRQFANAQSVKMIQDFNNHTFNFTAKSQ